MSQANSQSVASLVVLLFGLLGGIGLVASSPKVETTPVEVRPPLLRVAAIERERIQLEVHAQGTVEPRTEIDLVAEVSGRVTAVSPKLAAGAFFEAGDVLLEIDARDYELAVDRARTARTRAAAEAELASARHARLEKLAADGVSSTAALDDARAAARVADAVLAESETALVQARRELERTRIVAPFAGRVREQRVDHGQFVADGHAAARVYAVDYVEIRLPMLDRDAAFVALPVDGSADGPRVELTGTYLGREHTWHGRIVRTEGQIDPNTRMIHAVARVEDPYGRRNASTRPGDVPALPVGLFVEARILGRAVDDVVRVPRVALHDRAQVAVVDRDDRLRVRHVEVVQRQREHVIVAGGLQPGDRVCTSPPGRVIEGTPVRVEQTNSTATAATPTERRAAAPASRAS